MQMVDTGNCYAKLFLYLSWYLNDNITLKEPWIFQIKFAWYVLQKRINKVSKHCSPSPISKFFNMFSQPLWSTRTSSFGTIVLTLQLGWNHTIISDIQVYYLSMGLFNLISKVKYWSNRYTHDLATFKRRLCFNGQQRTKGIQKHHLNLN